MDPATQYLSQSGAEEFKTARKCLLPNEDVKTVCQMLQGFLVLSNRRMVFLKEEKELQFSIVRIIPYDCILNAFQVKPKRYRITGIQLDQFGWYDVDISEKETKYLTVEFDIHAPKSKTGESKEEIKGQFHSAMKQISEVLEFQKKTDRDTRALPPVRDYSYLDNIPESLTHNAILDLNNILQDMPIHDALYHDAMKFLGSEAFLLEESLRDANDIDNGFLFAAGNHGYIWIQGKKNGRHIENVLVDKIEWDNIKCAVHRWQAKDSRFDLVYTLQKEGTELTHHYKWNLTPNQDVLEHPWLLQQLNGPWILADIMYKYFGKPLLASMASKKHLQQSDMQRQRYYL